MTMAIGTAFTVIGFVNVLRGEPLIDGILLMMAGIALVQLDMRVTNVNRGMTTMLDITEKFLGRNKEG
jgi:anaerobic C4-dicarboxylate transporter